jgi:hypothetical protein
MSPTSSSFCSSQALPALAKAFVMDGGDTRFICGGCRQGRLTIGVKKETPNGAPRYHSSSSVALNRTKPYALAAVFSRRRASPPRRLTWKQHCVSKS